MEGLEEFKRRVRKVSAPRKAKVTGSLGIYDGYKYYRKTKPEGKKYILTESQYFAITRKVNDLLASEVANGNDLRLPCRMGTIEIRKNDRKVVMDSDGKMHNNLPIDWNKTLELWYEDKESHDNKTLVRMDEKEIFKIYFNRETATFNNKSYYEFVVNKDLKVRLKHKIKEGVIDAPYLAKKVRL